MSKVKEQTKTKIIETHDLYSAFGDHVVLKGINLSIPSASINTIIGGSGCGKSTLLRHFMLLLQPDSGCLSLFGETIDFQNAEQVMRCRRRMGVCFQSGALFSGLSVLENVEFVLKEYTDLPVSLRQECAKLKIRMAGLSDEAFNKLPSELSGGMQRRASIARAIALDPDLLLLDEPTAGLDPYSSRAFDDLILELKQSLGLTVVMVTHDVETSKNIADQCIYLYEGKVLVEGSYEEVVRFSHPEIQRYFCVVESSANNTVSPPMGV